MKIIYKNKNDFKKYLIELGANESTIKILKYAYSINFTNKNLKIIFSDSEV